ncbi:MAG: dTMP kinase [Rhizobiales bacterium]|nr:dTMP kinase [Hyphomicrobiales bacterium]
MAALFITFEGGEGAGKSTHCRLLAERLREMGREVTLTREPGGSPSAEQIRELLVSGATNRWSPEAEALLNYAARDSHLRETIRPALAGGRIVICDRFIDSTRAYQGYAGGCDMGLIDVLEKRIVGNDRPKLTFVFDLDVAQGLERAGGRATPGEDRFERKGLGFHQRLRNGFLAIAKAEPVRCKVIDASGPVEATAAAVWRHVEPLVS